MAGWHYRLNGHELVQAPGVGHGQESLVCCSPWGCKESGMSEHVHTMYNEQQNLVKSHGSHYNTI